jgi:decaprenyl-phosphate phosphoribosyltransferase
MSPVDLPALVRDLRHEPVMLAGSAGTSGEWREHAQPAARRTPRKPGPTARAAVALTRPRQWLKNGLILAAAGAAGALGHDDVPIRVTIACLAFCLLSGGIYAINDVRDRHEDRLHPRKCRRPVASGALRADAALLLGVVLILAGVVICTAIRPLLGVVGAGYVALTLSYTFVWREIVLFDLVAIAGGFVLRAVAGGVAAPVTLSRWFLLVVTAAAVMVAAGKRFAELRRTERLGARRRRVLEHYTPEVLTALLAGCGLTALFAYAMWAATVPTEHGFPWRPLTVIPFGACLLRYVLLVRAGAGETPEELVMGDRLLALAGVTWLVLFGLGVHAAG